MNNLPVVVLMYKMIVVQFQGNSYRLTDNGYAGISFEEYTDKSGYYPIIGYQWYPMDEEEVVAKFTIEERYAMEMMFDE
jgi:hypothetical protein